MSATGRLDQGVAPQIEGLYRLHIAGSLGPLDRRWLEVQKQLLRVAGWAVDRYAHGLYGDAQGSLTDDVGGDLLRKFIQKKYPEATNQFSTMLCTCARNSLNSSLRRTRSPSTVYFDGAEHTWADGKLVSAPDELSPDDRFGRIRANFRIFRFGEHELAREAVLAYLLTHSRYPGPGFLHALGVHHTVRTTIYNAAVVDINQAVLEAGPRAR